MSTKKVPQTFPFAQGRLLGSRSALPLLQPSTIVAGPSGGAALSLAYSFLDGNSHNNGNVMSFTNHTHNCRTQQG